LYEEMSLTPKFTSSFHIKITRAYPSNKKKKKSSQPTQSNLIAQFRSILRPFRITTSKHEWTRFTSITRACCCISSSPAQPLLPRDPSRRTLVPSLSLLSLVFTICWINSWFAYIKAAILLFFLYSLGARFRSYRRARTRRGREFDAFTGIN